jgi:uncharacterized protein (TIGR02266 family)
MAKVSVEAPAAGAGSAVERRKSDRAELVVRIDYSTVDELFSEFTRDINEGGVFIETADPRPPGTPVTLQFSLPGETDPVVTPGRVVWTSSGDDGEPPGMGIEFEGLHGETRRRIDAHVRSLRTRG